MNNENIIVKGNVSYYGKVKAIKGNKKVYRLTIENPEFRNMSAENLTKMYEGEKWKENRFLSSAVNGEPLECIMFHSEYPVENVFYDGEYMSIDDFEEITHEKFSLNHAIVEMKIYKGYIGKINLLENGKPYNPFE